MFPFTVHSQLCLHLCQDFCVVCKDSLLHQVLCVACKDTIFASGPLLVCKDTIFVSGSFCSLQGHYICVRAFV